MELKITSIEDINNVATEFVRLAMQEDTVFAFNGQMGAGKTYIHISFLKCSYKCK